MVLGFMLLLIPGLILMCLWSLVVPACVLERLGPLSSLSRSARLTKGYRWPVFGLILLTVIAGLILYAAARFYGDAADRQLRGDHRVFHPAGRHPHRISGSHDDHHPITICGASKKG